MSKNLKLDPSLNSSSESVEDRKIREQNSLVVEQMMALQKEFKKTYDVKSHKKLQVENSAWNVGYGSKKDIVSKDISFRTANALFEKGEYSLAKKIYYKLAAINPKLSFVANSMAIRCQQLDLDSGSFNLNLAEIIYKNDDTGWTAIITLYKRQDYLPEQLMAIKNQSIPPDSIIIIQNENHIEIDPFIIQKFNLKVIRSDINSLYFRWIVGYLVDSCYVCVFDDDVIPGSRWIESCFAASRKFNALVGPSGRRAAPKKKEKAWKSIENLSVNTYEFCDWVCNSYFFKKEWIKYVVEASRYGNTQKTFDDIQLATTLKMYGDINTVVPPQVDKKSIFNGHIRREYGHDEHALWKRHASDHADQRRELIQKLDESGFPWVTR
ncbi:hypothetical protein [Vreelandella sp. TE19]